MDDRRLAELADANCAAAFSLLAGHTGGFVEDEDGILTVSTGLPVREFNLALALRPPRDPATAVSRALGRLRATGLPYHLRVREGLDPNTETAGVDAGLAVGETVPVMTLHPLADAPPSRAGLRIERPRDLDAYAHVVSEGFGMPRDLVDRAFGGDLAREREVEALIGFAGDTAVATAMLVLSGDTAGVYNIATLPAHRRRGYGEAMTWATVRAGAERGASVAALQATPMGLPVYERMGFRIVTRYLTYTLPD
jgi:GNAT superfamily N-acetyltransferase